LLSLFQIIFEEGDVCREDEKNEEKDQQEVGNFYQISREGQKVESGPSRED
jgi:hypothetical protein